MLFFCFIKVTYICILAGTCATDILLNFHAVLVSSGTVEQSALLKSNKLGYTVLYPRGELSIQQ